jgi:phage-related protein
MDKQWDIEFFSESGGVCEVGDWIMKLKISQRDKVIAWIDKLQEMGPLLPRPYADLLRDGIHELRIKIPSSQIRILYFFVFEDRIVLTHPFYKNAAKVSEKEIKKAIPIREEYIKRSEK